MENNRLIAFNILKQNILSNDYCTGCGACEATCPVNALQVKDDKVQRLFNCSENMDLCPICNQVCPHSQALLLRSAEVVSDAPVRSDAVGYFRRILLAQAGDQVSRENGSDGNAVSSLLAYGLNNKVFDGAVVTGKDGKNPLKPIAQVAVTPEEVEHAEEGKFYSSKVVEAYRNAVVEYGKEKIAVVGTPCQVLALRKIDAWGHKIGGKAKIVIGLFCYGTLSSKPFANYLMKKFGVSENDVTGMQLAHDLTVYTKQGTYEVPLGEAKVLTNLGCKTCIDYTSELADISVGTAYPQKEWSTVILRTKTGEDFFNSAIQNGAINARSIEGEPEAFEHLIVSALRKRTAGLVKAGKLEQKRNYVPVRVIRDVEALASVKVEDIMTREVVTVPSTMPVSTLLSMMASKSYIGYPVINERNELAGVVTIEEATKVDKAAGEKTLVGSIARPNLEVCYPGESARDAFKKMSSIETGRVLILDPNDPKKIVGIVTKGDLMHALIKRASEDAAA